MTSEMVENIAEAVPHGGERDGVDRLPPERGGKLTLNTQESSEVKSHIGHPLVVIVTESCNVRQ